MAKEKTVDTVSEAMGAAAKKTRAPRGPNAPKSFGKTLGDMIDAFDKIPTGQREQILDLLVTRYTPEQKTEEFSVDLPRDTFAPNSAE